MLSFIRYKIDIILWKSYKYIKYQKLPNKVEFKDELHLSDITLLKLMQNILLNI